MISFKQLIWIWTYKLIPFFICALDPSSCHFSYESKSSGLILWSLHLGYDQQVWLSKRITLDPFRLSQNWMRIEEDWSNLTHLSWVHRTLRIDLLLQTNLSQKQISLLRLKFCTREDVCSQIVEFVEEMKAGAQSFTFYQPPFTYEWRSKYLW